MSQDLTPRALVELTPDAVFAPWTAEEVYRLNRRQEDDRVSTFRCPHDQIELFATLAGWVCAGAHCGFKQEWAPERYVRNPFVPPPRSGR